MATVIEADFEWDDAKALTNIQKHGVSFPEAVTAFEDPHAPVRPDGNGNLILIGFSIRARLVTVVHEDRLPRLRLISAWLSTPPERREYGGTP